ncbi:uncharacterized protein LOC143235302 [Tachypleus tridentatus]|uniref:uncharacterized protein LOC143235302 n=1 Tax=Tachypleus tridentatus TaxID=6853 RepID=UPI003FD23800
MKVEPFSEEEQDVLVDKKLEKNEHETFTTMNVTGKTHYFEERSPHTNFKFDVIKEETEDVYDGDEDTVETDCILFILSTLKHNIHVQVKAEQPDHVLEGDVISKFSDSNDNDLDSSSYNYTNVKMKTEFQEEIASVLDSTSGELTLSTKNLVLKMDCYQQFVSNSFLIQM